MQKKGGRRQTGISRESRSHLLSEKKKKKASEKKESLTIPVAAIQKKKNYTASKEGESTAHKRETVFKHGGFRDAAGGEKKCLVLEAEPQRRKKGKK